MILKEMIEKVTYNEVLDAFAAGYGTRFEHFVTFDKVYNELVQEAKTFKVKPQKHHIAIIDSKDYDVAFAIVVGDKRMPFLIGRPEKILNMEVEISGEKCKDMTLAEQLLLVILSRACFFERNSNPLRPDQYVRMLADYKEY